MTEAISARLIRNEFKFLWILKSVDTFKFIFEAKMHALNK